MESLMPEITSNPGSCCAYLTPRFYYAIGNTTVDDLTEGCCIPDEASFLLLGCGDIRNILHTVSEIQKLEGCHPKSVHFHLNDVDPCVLARDAVLLSLVNTIDPNNGDDLHLLWSVWYNLALTENEFHRLQTVLMDLLDNTGMFGLSYGGSKLKSTLRKVWKTWLTCGTDLETVQRNRRLFIRKRESKKQGKELTWEEAHQTLSLHLSRRGDVWGKEADTYVASGSIRENSQLDLPNTNLNATFVRQDARKWMVHPDGIPFVAWEHHSFDKNMSLTTQCLEQLRSSVRLWQAFQKRSGMVKVTLWGGDCLELMDCLPEDVRFDFINTSNLADHIGLLNILLWSAPRLKTQGLLTTQSLVWKEFFKTVKQYLDHHFGFPASLFPAILGVRLVDDLEMGTSKQTAFGWDPNSIALSLRWLQSSGESTALSLDGTDGVSQAVLVVAKKCLAFRAVSPDRSGSLFNNSLTLIRLVQLVAEHIQDGAKSILDLISRAFSSVIEVNGSKDGPLSQSWQTILAANRVENQECLDDLIRKVDVPVELTLFGKITIERFAGVGMGIGMQGCIIENPVDLFPVTNQTSCKMPATTGPVHILPCLGYDYETSRVTFYIRKPSWNRLPRLSVFVFMTKIIPGVPFFEPVLNLRHVATITDVPWQSSFKAGGHDAPSKSPQVALCEEDTTYSLVWSPGAEACRGTLKSEFSPVEDPNTVTMTLQQSKGTEDPRRAVCSLTCPVVRDSCKFQLRRKSGKVVATLPKRIDWFVGCLELPYRRIKVDRTPALIDTSDQVDDFDICLRTMFSGPGEQMLKQKQGPSTDPFYNLRETLHALFVQTLKHPQIKAYRIVVKDHSSGQKFAGPSCHVVIHVRGLHSLNGLPTLDLDWIDCSRANNMVQTGQLDHEVVHLVTLKHCVGKERAIHTKHVTKKEATLLKRLLGCNSRRVLQDSAAATAGWLLSSYLQPLYPREGCEVPNNQEELMEWEEKMKAATAGTTGELQEQSIQRQPEKYHCSLCGRVASDLRLCTRCKSAFYCNSDCQGADWPKHKVQCHGATRTPATATTSQPAPTSAPVPTPAPTPTHTPTEAGGATGKPDAPIPTELQTCGGCGRSGSGLRKCARCRAMYYCNANCQHKHWREHKTQCKK